MIYLLHFVDGSGKTARLKHAGHYLGYTENLDERLEAHRKGQGARLVEVIMQAGLSFVLAKTWEGDRKVEKSKKGTASQICPICRAEARRGAIGPYATWDTAYAAYTSLVPENEAWAPRKFRLWLVGTYGVGIRGVTVQHIRDAARKTKEKQGGEEQGW